jgi:uncharacterized protein (DUF1778 family)
MGGKSPGSAYITVQLTIDEKTILDDAAEKAEMNRNAFIRKWINSLARKK